MKTYQLTLFAALAMTPSAPKPAGRPNLRLVGGGDGDEPEMVPCRFCGVLSNRCTDDPRNIVCPVHGIIREKADDQPRDDDGRYSHEMEALCKCGHTKGEHVAERVDGVQECLAGECWCDSFTADKLPKPKMTPAYCTDGEMVPAYTEKDRPMLERLAGIAQVMWNEEVKAGLPESDFGTCVLGAGFTVWFRGKRKRVAKPLKLVTAPGQTDCRGTSKRAEAFLKRHLEGVSFAYGNMD